MAPVAGVARPDVSQSGMRYGTLGRVLHVDLTTKTSWVESIDEQINREFLAGYGLGAYLMWKHFPPRADALAPEACFAICAGLLTGVHTPFSGRIQIVGKSPLTGTWADSNSGGSVAIWLKRAGYDALVVRGQAATPTVLVICDDEVRFDDAGNLWGQEVPAAFDELKARYGGKSEVGVSAIGPAGEQQTLIASVQNDRYHAFARQGFGAIYGAKRLKAIVVSGTGKVPIARPDEFAAICKEVNADYRRDLGWFARVVVALAKPRRMFGWVYRLFAVLGAKITTPAAAMRQIWTRLGTTSAVAISVENGDAPIKNWTGVGVRDFPLSRSMKIDGEAVLPYVTKKLSCGDCPIPCKGIVATKTLRDVRRPDYETLVGFGANLLQDDVELVTACHDACNRFGIDALSASATLAWVCEATEKGLLTPADLDGLEMKWGNGDAALALTIKMGSGQGCGAWLRHGSRMAAAHIGRGTDDFVVAVRGQEPAYHDTRFSAMMGMTFVTDPTPGRHTAGSGAWNENFAVGFPLPDAVAPDDVRVAWKGTENKGRAQAHFSNAHQVLNGLGLCMFTNLTGQLPWTRLVNALTGWNVTDADLLRAGERIGQLRAAFNVREGLSPADVTIHRRLLGEGDGHLTKGPLRGVRVPLPVLREDYFASMKWDAQGKLQLSRAKELGLDSLLAGYLAP